MTHSGGVKGKWDEAFELPGRAVMCIYVRIKWVIWVILGGGGGVKVKAAVLFGSGLS